MTNRPAANSSVSIGNRLNHKISWMLWRFIARPLLFSLPAEPTHHLSMALFHTAMFPPLSNCLKSWLEVHDPRLATEIEGIPFANPVGLAAGFDKQARWFNSLACLGFSHIEVGTITAKPQAGNPKPRLFRLPADKALVNRMGFNNPGAAAVASVLGQKRIQTVLGINIGKSKVVDIDRAVDDYLESFRTLYPLANYFAINVSSPNTPGLRGLQDRQPLTELLSQIADVNRQLAVRDNRPPKPVFLKIAPDLDEAQLDDIVAIVSETRVGGIIATNTTTSRDRLASPPTTVQRAGDGGLSGAPLTIVSRRLVSDLYRRFGGSVPIIGVGGIMDGQDAWNMICAGANLIQVYTGFVYGGPRFVNQINRHLLQMLDEHGLDSIGQAVGTAVS